MLKSTLCRTLGEAFLKTLQFALGVCSGMLVYSILSHTPISTKTIVLCCILTGIIFIFRFALIWWIDKKSA